MSPRTTTAGIKSPLPYVSPIDPAELRRRNAAAIRLLDEWEAEGDEADQRATMAVLRETLGARRIAATRGLYP